MRLNCCELPAWRWVRLIQGLKLFRCQCQRERDGVPRYALFTLVGIAGEDDIDAPDLTEPTPETEKPKIDSKSGGQQIHSDRRTSRRSEALTSSEDAALWAHRRLVAKNQLSAADAQQVEEAFAVRLAAIPTPAIPTQSAKRGSAAIERGVTTGSLPIDKSTLGFPEPRRLRDRDHIRYVMKQPCLICGRRPSDPHHLRFAQCRALSRKVSDEFTVPLCRSHHRELHRCGDEGSWWQNAGIDPLTVAGALWLETHPLRTMENTATNG
jgi:hypothetical protein